MTGTLQAATDPHGWEMLALVNFIVESDPEEPAYPPLDGVNVALALTDPGIQSCP